MSDFLSLRISKTMVEKLHQNGIAIPTPIQERTIPALIDGKDLIAQAQTGTGKTLAFLLPILERIEPNTPHIQALILTPTRELALQITEELHKLTADLEGVDTLAVYGGQDVEKQLKKLRNGIQLVVATPGRLLDHLRRGTLSLQKITYLVLDEADQMLHIGFLDEVETIMKETPITRQTSVFSATIPPEIRKLAVQYMREPEYIQVEKKQGPALTVKQLAIHTTDRAKQGTLIELIETQRPYMAVIFCRTKRRVSKLFGVLKAHGFSCDELHGDISQGKREQVMKKFRNGEIQLLVATDVAARGLDVEGVTHVFNYDIPQDAESYVHRIGRTGRAGMKGLAVTLYSSDDRATLDLIEKELTIQIPKKNIGNMDNKDGVKQKLKSQGKDPKRDPKKEQQKDSKKDPKKDSKKEPKKDFKKDSKKDFKKDSKKDFKKNPTKEPKKDFNKDSNKDSKKNSTKNPKKDFNKDPKKDPKKEKEVRAGKNNYSNPSKPKKSTNKPRNSSSKGTTQKTGRAPKKGRSFS